MDNSAISRADKATLQAEWLNFRMAENPRWKRDMPGPKLHTVSGHKVFVAWKLKADGQPEIIDVLRVTDIEASFSSGITVLFSGTATTIPIRVSTHPREITPGLFAWIPPFSEVRYCPHTHRDPGSVWRLTLPMFVRSEAGPRIEVGQPVLMPHKEFRDRWPNITL